MVVFGHMEWSRMSLEHAVGLGEWEARVMGINGKKATLKFRVSDEVKTAALGTKRLRPCSWLKLAVKQ